MGPPRGDCMSSAQAVRPLAAAPSSALGVPLPPPGRRAAALHRVLAEASSERKEAIFSTVAGV
jgi:hypothetical protein